MSVPRLREAHQRWTREEALEWYRRAREHYGRVPTMADMVPYQSTFVRLFGSVSGFQRAAGDEPRRPGRPRKEVP